MDRTCDPGIQVFPGMDQGQENRLRPGPQPLMEVAQRAVLAVSTGGRKAALGEHRALRQRSEIVLPAVHLHPVLQAENWGHI